VKSCNNFVIFLSVSSSPGITEKSQWHGQDLSSPTHGNLTSNCVTTSYCPLAALLINQSSTMLAGR